MSGAPSGSPLNPCLVSAWPMNEGSGLTLHDTSTGGTNTATITNAGTVTWQTNTGFPGTTPLWHAVGTGALATSTTLTNFTGTTPFSVSIWGRQGAGGGDGLMSTLDTARRNPERMGNRYQYLTCGGGGFGSEFTFTVSNTFPSNAIQVGSTNAVPSTGANYLVATYDGSGTTTGVKLYINGSLETNHVAVSGPLTATAANSLPVRIGSRNDGTFQAHAPEAFAEIYNCVLTSGQISTYNAAGPGIY